MYLDAAATQGIPEILAEFEDEARAVDDDDTDEHEDEPALTIGCVRLVPETMAPVATPFGELAGDDEFDPGPHSSCKLQLPLR